MEVVAVAAPVEEEGRGGWWGGRRANRLIPVQPQTTLTVLQTLTLPEGVQLEAITASNKMREQSTLPRPQLTAIPDELGEYIAR